MFAPMSHKAESVTLSDLRKPVRVGWFWRVSAERLHIFAMLAIALSFILMGGLRAMATPLVDNQGGFPDEVFHFARSLERARQLTHGFGMDTLRFSHSDLSALSTRGVDLCGLGFGGVEECDHNPYSVPVGSGDIRGSGVYWLHGIAQFLLPVIHIESRLLLGRITSLCVGLVLVWTVYGLGNLIYDDRRIAVAVAAMVVMMPSVNGIVSVVSTEGPALVAVAILLWIVFAIYRNGFSVVRILMLGIGVLACAFTKLSAFAVVPVAGLLLLKRLGFRWDGLLLAILTGISSFAIGVGVVGSSSKPAGAAHWYFERSPILVPVHGTGAKLAERGLDENELGLEVMPPLGQWVLSTGVLKSPVLGEGVVQFLPNKVAAPLAGKLLSVGAWIKAPAGTMINTPAVILRADATDSDTLPVRVFTASGDWQFVANEVQLPSHISNVGVLLYHESDDVIWDGVTMIVGSFVGSGQPPSYDSPVAITGEWAGLRFENLLKNGSVETSWSGVPAGLRAFTERVGTSTWANRLDGQLFSLWDFERTSVGYLLGLRAIFSTFWGSFVGGDWPGLARWHYVVAAVVILLAGLGWLWSMRQPDAMAEAMPATETFILLLVALMYTLIGVVRMDVSAEWVPPLFYATSRHVLPAITPVALLTVGGLVQLFPKRVTPVVLALLIAGVFLANTWMLLRVELPYFNCPLEIRWACTAL